MRLSTAAPIRMPKPDGETPLHTAIRNGGNLENPKVVEALLGSGADPCITDAAGYIPYNTAREGGTVHSMLANAGGSDFTCDDAPEIVEADLVRRIQAALAAKGYNPGPADGVMGGQTHAAIEAWQDAMGFPATGGLTAEEVDVLLAEAASLEPSSGSPGPLCSGTGKEDGCWFANCGERQLLSLETLSVTRGISHVVWRLFWRQGVRNGDRGTDISQLGR